MYEELEIEKSSEEYWEQLFSQAENDRELIQLIDYIYSELEKAQ